MNRLTAEEMEKQAEDTVMSGQTALAIMEEIKDDIDRSWLNECCVRQAEISFKAGAEAQLAKLCEGHKKRKVKWNDLTGLHTSEGDIREKIDKYLCKPFDGEVVHVSGEDKVRLALSERVALVDQITPLIVEYTRKAVADEIKKGLEEFLKFSALFTTINHPNEWQTFWDKYLKGD